MRRGRQHSACRVLKACVASMMAVALACGIVGCKTTDFFTEVLISPDASTVDQDNQDKTIINSPDASKESSALSALDWSDESSTTEDVENLVTWSDKPNSTLSTRHSHYDPKPLFPGIESSDGVRLVFNADASLDHEVDNANGQSNDSMKSVSAGKNGTQTTNDSVQQGNGASAVDSGGNSEEGKAEAGEEESQQQGDGDSQNASGDAAGQGDSGGEGSGEDEGNGSSPKTDDKKKGDTVDKHGGFGGSLTVYDPDNPKAKIPKVDSVAVIGKRAAVMVQAIGGEGAICAMSKAAYNDTDAGTAKSFKDVFGDECPSSVIAWDADDSSIKKVKASKLAKAFSGKGKTLILYDQSLVDGDDDPNKTFFTEKQLEALDEAGVAGFAPLSFDTEYGIVDAAYYVGQALSSSTALAEGWSSADMATDYVNALNSIVKATVSVNGSGNWVYGDEASSSMATEYKGNTVNGAGTQTYVHGIIATDAQTGLSYSGDSGQVDASGIILFAGCGQNKYSPLGFWMQAAGVADGVWTQNATESADDEATSPKFLTLLWGTSASSSIDKKKLTGSGGAYINWHGAVSDMMVGTMNNTNGGSTEGGGLGSKNMPYLIVSGSQSDSSLTGAKVKQAVVKSINSASNYTPYTAFEYISVVRNAVAPYNSAVRSSIGDTNERKSENPFKAGLSAEDVVRVNPTGLLESWTRGNAESVLEAAWLACIYSKSPAGCDYQPPEDKWKDFSAKIGDTEVKGNDYNGDAAATLQALVKEFYSKFYRYSVDYSQIVTDEGLAE